MSENSGFKFEGENSYDSLSRGSEPPGGAVPSAVSPNMLRRGSVSAECMNSPEVDEVHEKVVIPKSKEARDRIESAVSNNLLFKNLDIEQKNEIIDAMFEKHFNADDIVIKQGDPGDFFYVIDSGNFEILINGEVKGEYLGVGAFGELALMYNTPRAATIKATSDASVWCVDRFTFRKTINSHNYRKRKMYEGFIRSIPLLASLSPLQISKVADCLEPVEYDDGVVIIRQGDEGDHFYIVLDGEAKISLQKDDDSEPVSGGVLRRGDYFGEMALIKNSPRAATVTASGLVKCVSLDAKAFVRLFGPLMEMLNRNMDEYKKYEELMNC